MIMKTTTVVLTLTAVIGCASEKKRDEAYRAKQSPGITAMADNPEFETAKSPSITADTQFAAGQLAESQGSFDVAQQRYEQALQIDPKHQSTLYRSAIVHTQLKQYPAAIGRWNRYVEASNGNATGYNNLALTYELAAKPLEAETTYKHGVAKNPQDETLHVNYGLMLARAGRISEAEAQLKKVLQPAEVAYNIGSVYEELGKKDQAKQKYQEALSLNPKMTDAQTRLLSAGIPKRESRPGEAGVE